MRLGVTLPVPGLDLPASIELACLAERLGFAEAWSSEVASHDGFTPLAALAARTERLRLGVGLVPASTRPPALLAMSAASLHELSGGRFALGLGSSSPQIVERWMGQPPGTSEHPVTRVRETVEAVRLALSGERVSYAGQTVAFDGFRLGLGAADVPIVLGALGPRMLRLAGEVGDGVLLTLTTAEALPSLLGDVAAGARAEASVAALHLPADFGVVCRVPVALGEDTPELRDSLRRFVAGYAAVPAYNRLVRRQGFADEATAISAAAATGDRAGAAAAVSDALLQALVVLGPLDDCLARLAAFRDAGAGTLLVSPITAAVDPAQRHDRVAAALTQIAAAFAASDPDAEHVAHLLGGIPGAAERVQQGIDQARRGEGSPLDDLA